MDKLEILRNAGYNTGNTMATKIQIDPAIWIMEMIRIQDAIISNQFCLSFA